MKHEDSLSINYTDRIVNLLEISWRILKTRFNEKRHQITTEAPFQHHFAHIISTLGELHCTRRDDIFHVDLETRCEDIKGKSKYIDITCNFTPEPASCAIELKFKTSKQGAQDHGRIDMFIDIEALELVCEKDYNIGRFYMITDSLPYINKSKRGVGTHFTTYDGALVGPGQFHCPQSKGRENVIVNLKNEYLFEWEKINNWYFLQINVDR